MSNKQPIMEAFVPQRIKGKTIPNKNTQYNSGNQLRKLSVKGDINVPATSKMIGVIKKRYFSILALLYLSMKQQLR